MSRRTFLCQLLAATGAATLLTASGAVSLAQDATPSATKVDDAVVHPVSIHQGTCDEPVPQPVGQTADSQIVGLDDDALFIGATSQPPVVSARLDFDGTIDDLTETPHVVAVHTRPQEYGSIVACGEITPSVPPDHTIGICRTSSMVRLPLAARTSRKARSAMMRV